MRLRRDVSPGRRARGKLDWVDRALFALLVAGLLLGLWFLFHYRGSLDHFELRLVNGQILVSLATCLWLAYLRYWLPRGGRGAAKWWREFGAVTLLYTTSITAAGYLYWGFKGAANAFLWIGGMHVLWWRRAVRRPPVPVAEVPVAEILEDRRGQACVMCGRSVEGLAEARRVRGQWFCSPGHVLEAEAKIPRRARRPWGGGVAALLLLAVFLTAVVWLDHGQNTNADPFSSDPLEALAKASEAQGTTDFFRGKLTPAAQSIAEKYLVDEYVKRDCSAANSNYDPSATGPDFPPPCSTNQSYVPQSGRDYLVRGAPRILRHCQFFAFKVSECYVFTLIDYTNKLSSIGVGKHMRKTWSYAVSNDQVWLSHRHDRWVVVYETLGETTTEGSSPAVRKLWSRRIASS